MPNLSDGITPLPDGQNGKQGDGTGKGPKGGRMAPMWVKGQTGNPLGINQSSKSLAQLARDQTDNGRLLMSALGLLLRGEPLNRKQRRLLSSEEMDRQFPSKDGKPGWKRRHWIVETVKYYPTMEDFWKAWDRLSARGWGEAPKEVIIRGEGSPGFTIIRRRWEVGCDPVKFPDGCDEYHTHQDGRIIDTKALPPAPENGHSGNGHKP